MEKMLDCSELLTNCMENHMDEATALIFNMPVNLKDWSQTMEKCQSQQRYKRSAGKDRVTSSIGRVASRLAATSSIGRSLGHHKIPSASIGKSRDASLVQGFLGKSTKGLASTHQSGSLAKKGIFGKVGKYAVAGLAAYGTYKLAKSMTKGLRREYDDDDCWQYSILRDRYECVCNAQCNVYVGSSSSMTASLSTLAVTTILSVIYNTRFFY